MVLRFTGTMVIIFSVAGVLDGRLSIAGAVLCTVVGAAMVACGERAA